MNTDQFITELSKNYKAPAPLESFLKRFLKWLLISTLCLISGFAFLGMREDWQVLFNDPSLLIQNAFIALGVVISAVAALLLSVPGNESKRVVKVAVVAAFSLWALALVFMNLSEPKFKPGIGLNCLKDTLIFGFIPGLYLYILVNKGATLRRDFAGFATLAAATGLGAWGVQFTCHNDHPAHVLLWHFVPVLFMGLAGIWIGQWILRRI